MKGAAFCGLKDIAPLSRLCRRHYGFSWNIRYKAEEHDGFEHYWDEFQGYERVKGMLEWSFKKV